MKLEIRFVKYDVEQLAFVEVDERYIYNAKSKGAITRKVNTYRDRFVVAEYARGEDFVVYRAMLRISPITDKPMDREKTVHITIHDEEGKMADIKSISTCCLLNPICIQRALLAGCVCSECYAKTDVKYKPGLKKWLIWNFAVLNLGILDNGDLPVITDDIFRIESFGDVATEFCAINYLHIIYKNKRTWFSVWTKNAGLWDRPIKRNGRPKNATFILSSPFINVELDLELMQTLYPWVDKVFTVYDDETESNCAGLGCRHQCGRCYGQKSRKTDTNIRERLRKRGGKKKPA